MADNKLMKQVAKVPIAQPGFDALGVSAPVIVQVNPEGKWESKKPNCLDEERLKSVIQHLVNSKAISAAQSYCCQCALENKNSGIESNYVPVIMMPIYSADECPFDLDCEVQKMKNAENKPSKNAKRTEMAKSDGDDKDKDKVTKPKKRGFVMQRLTDFDLLSQW